jgi:hypothetical protein
MWLPSEGRHTGLPLQQTYGIYDFERIEQFEPGFRRSK